MSERSDQRETIIADLKAFENRPLAEPARKIFASLANRLPTHQILHMLDL
jgi:hypothetical protein